MLLSKNEIIEADLRNGYTRVPNHILDALPQVGMNGTQHDICHILLRETYGSKIKVFRTEIPHSVRAKEISAEGKSIFAHDPNGKVAEGYKNLTQEVIKLEKQREKSRAGIGR